MSPVRTRSARTCASIALLASAAHAQTDDFGENPIPDLFAALMTMTLSEEVSAGSFRVASDSEFADDTRFRTYHIPWRTELEDSGWRFDGAVGVLTADDHLEVPTASGTSIVDENWRTAGAQLGVSAGVPLGERWNLRPGVALALAYLENDASYNAAAETDVAPLIDGKFVNWDAWAAIGSLSLTLERPRERGVLATGLVARAVAAGTQVFGASSDFQEGFDTSAFVLTRGEVGAPFEFQCAGEPVEWDLSLAWVQLLDTDRDVLGFDAFTQASAGIAFTPWRAAPRVRFSGSLASGEDVRGWSLGLSLAP